MPEHRIRLRGAWDRIEGPTDPPRRLDLPVRWSPIDRVQPFTLRRAFGRPPVDPSRESVILELLDVPGLVAVRLNGALLVGSDGLTDSVRLEIGARLLARNVVELDVAAGPGWASVANRSWGAVALVISDRPA